MHLNIREGLNAKVNTNTNTEETHKTNIAGQDRSGEDAASIHLQLLEIRFIFSLTWFKQTIKLLSQICL